LDAVLFCLTEQHDWRVVAVAAVVCFGGLLTSLNLYQQARLSRGMLLWGALTAAPVVGGLAIWATHFIAMQGFRPGVETSYALLPTLGSLTLVVGGSAGAMLIGVLGRGRPGWGYLSATVGASGTAAMHYLGMSGLRLDGARISWSPGLVVASLLASWAVSLGCAVVPGRGHRAVLMQAALGSVSVVLVHFLGMSAVTITPAVTGAWNQPLLPDTVLLSALAAIVALLAVSAAMLTTVGWWSRSSALRQIREAIDAMPDGLGFYDANDRLVLWNARYAEVNRELGEVLMPGMSFEDIVQVGLDAGIYSDAAGREAAFLRERLAQRTQLSHTSEQRVIGDRWLRIHDRRTESGSLVTVVNDITDQKLDAQALVEARDAAEEANRAKSQFLANMSHEIRTPLNGIIGLAQALGRTDLADNQREMLDLIQSSGQTLQTLLSDILDLARVESGRLTITEEPLDLARTVMEAGQLYAATAHDRGLGFHVEVDPDAAVWVRGDAVRLKQILTNLISNAVKFTERGFVRVTVGRATDRDDRAVLRFCVEDTGIGFSAETKERLFSRFEQADGGITRRFGGSGLGLAICRQLAELMGGSLDCESDVGAGSCFIRTVPMALTAAPVARDAAPTLEAAGSGVRVLLADDHPTNRKVVELILAGLEVELVQVENGAEAVELFRQGSFDLVLMDMQMPVMDGLTATRAIRAEEAASGRARTPLVMLTANALPEHVAASQAAGADSHLAKPFNAVDLLTLVADPFAALAPSPEAAAA
jgi:signal transduction histidine kinase/NO-binding membrane sensor protein with MHYT domain/CheY-like chemotaxis protein